MKDVLKTSAILNRCSEVSTMCVRSLAGNDHESLELQPAKVEASAQQVSEGLKVERKNFIF